MRALYTLWGFDLPKLLDQTSRQPRPTFRLQPVHIRKIWPGMIVDAGLRLRWLGADLES